MLNRTSNPGFATTVICASFLVSACGGGGDGGSPSGSSASSGGDFSTLKAGLFNATVTYTNTNGAPPKTATTYLSPTGQFAIVFGANAGLSFGTLTFDRLKINGTSNDYRQLTPDNPDPKGFLEEKDPRQGKIKGAITSQGSATFTTSDSEDQVNTTVTLQRQNALSNLGLSLSRVSGTYVMSVTGEPDVSLSVDSNGSLYAEYYTVATGCRLGGIESLSVPDPSINAFNIAYTMSGCTKDIRNGDYSGVGFVGPTTDQRMQMIFAAHNGKVAMRFEGIK